MSALRARGVAKQFESTHAVDGVDLELRKGEVRGLLGLNGAGKTTLLRMLLGLVRPGTGSIELLGRRLDAKTTLRWRAWQASSRIRPSIPTCPGGRTSS